MNNIEQKAPGDFPRISVIICTLNEEACLPQVLPKIPSFVDEVILVDGHSTDNTVAVAKSLRPGTRIFYQPAKGKPDALLHGFKHATGDIIVTLDADGQTDPEVMSQFIEPLVNGYHFVKGSRFLHSQPQGMPWHRRFGNWAFVTLANLLYGTKYTELCSGYNAFWKEILNYLKLPQSFDNDVLIHLRVAKLGINCIEVPHFDAGRMKGRSKAPALREGYRILKVIIGERFRKLEVKG
jgi:glycosyltransferase involved in cell wall biosynthesis